MRRLPTFIVGLGVAVLAFVAINAAMKPVSKSSYCGTNCHEMKSAYQAWELSAHGVNRHGVRIDCVDCHLPPKERYFANLFAKARAGAKDTYKHHFGGEYDGEKMRKKVRESFSNDICLHCHEDLLVCLPSFAAQDAHTGLMNHPDADENRCVNCHAHVGHEPDIAMKRAADGPNLIHAGLNTDFDRTTYLFGGL